MNLRVLLPYAVFVLFTTSASAQVAGTGVTPVVEIGANLYQNTVTAAQSVLIVKHQVEELLPLGDFIAVAGIMEDMGALAEIASQTQALSFDIQSLNQQIHVLFDLQTAPDTRQGLDERLLEIKRIVFECRVFAVRTQTLMMTLFHTVEHLQGLLGSIQAFVGQKQAMQTLVQTNGTISKTLAVMEVQNVSIQRADMVERLSEGVIIESLTKISIKSLERHPRP